MKSCLTCGKDIPSRAKRCSKCQYRHNLEEQKRRYNETKPLQDCLRCGTKHRRTNRYCSDACRAQAAAARAPKGPQVKNCSGPSCNTVFVTQRRKMYCSVQCKNRDRYRYKKPGVQIACLVCRKPVTVHGNTRQGRLCSDVCRRVHNATKFKGIKGIPVAIRVMLNMTHCESCNRPFDSGGKLDKRHIDHDHDTGYFRGIICGRCNLVEGLMDTKSLRQLADYIESRTPANEITGYIRVEPNSETPATRQHG